MGPHLRSPSLCKGVTKPPRLRVGSWFCLGVGDGLGQTLTGQVQPLELKGAKREAWLGVRAGVASTGSPITVRCRPLTGVSCPRLSSSGASITSPTHSVPLLCFLSACIQCSPGSLPQKLGLSPEAPTFTTTGLAWLTRCPPNCKAEAAWRDSGRISSPSRSLLFLGAGPCDP